ncbi:MAG: hypothetical protein QF909_17560, partial [SAR202 cluster bacterium]|nr:hypothetical protein [SAR202 cluster bacterium]
MPGRPFKNAILSLLGRSYRLMRQALKAEATNVTGTTGALAVHGQACLHHTPAAPPVCPPFALLWKPNVPRVIIYVE